MQIFVYACIHKWEGNTTEERERERDKGREQQKHRRGEFVCMCGTRRPSVRTRNMYKYTLPCQVKPNRAMQCKAKPKFKPVEHDVHNFNAILKLIWKFTQAIELNESFIVYLVLRFVCLCAYLYTVRMFVYSNSVSLDFLFILEEGGGPIMAWEICSFYHCTPFCHKWARCTYDTMQLKKRRKKEEWNNKNELLAFYILVYEWIPFERLM